MPMIFNYLFLISIVITGASGIIAQVLILRELLIVFYGNELTIGIILANWILSEALGVLSIGKLTDLIKEKIGFFAGLGIIFAASLPFSLYFARTSKQIFGIPFGESLGLPMVGIISLLASLLPSFCHGGLFSCACNIGSSFTKKKASTIGKIYALEMLGTIMGGVAVTYLLVPRFNTFQIVFIFSLLNSALFLLFFRYSLNKNAKFFVFLASLFAILVFLIIKPNYLHNISLKEQWGKRQILDYRNSIYGNITVTRQDKQTTFFYNGLPLITTPYPDIAFVEEFGHFPLFFHRQPDDILVISMGAGGLISEILKHKIMKLDYVELDPLVIQMLKKYPSGLTSAELNDKRVNIINTDGRFFMRTADNSYDIVLIGITKPSDLSTNRFFTSEFFSLVKERLKPEGILAFYLPGSLSYISNEMRDLNFSILNGLRRVYKYIKIIPGDNNLYLASASPYLMAQDAKAIILKITQQNIKTKMLEPLYLEYRLDQQWLHWFMQETLGATMKINEDLRPFALFQMQVFWNKQFSTRLTQALVFFEKLSLKIIFLLITAVNFMLYIVFLRKQPLKRLKFVYAIATTGFFGMLMNLILIFSFQVTQGYLFQSIGFLISIFMGGAATGGFVITKYMETLRSIHLRLFISLEAVIAFLSLLFAIILTQWVGKLNYAFFVYSALFFISGFLVGVEFPLASQLYLKDESEIGSGVGLLYFADLAGGWCAGLVGGVILLPILGVFQTCLVISMLKISSLFLLNSNCKS